MQRAEAEQEFKMAKNLSVKHVFDLAVRAEPFYVLLHEEEAPPVGCADAEAARAAALCEAQGRGLFVGVTLQDEGFDVKVVVQSFVLRARSSPEEQPVVLVTLLRAGKAHLSHMLAREKKGVPAMRRSFSVPQSLRGSISDGMPRRVTSESNDLQHTAQRRGTVEDWAAAGLEGHVRPEIGVESPGARSSTGQTGGVPSPEPQMLRVGVRSLDPSAADSDGCEIGVSVTLLPVRILLGPCLLVRRLQVCVDELLQGLKIVFDRRACTSPLSTPPQVTQGARLSRRPLLRC